jgi:hypothetical protein
MRASISSIPFQPAGGEVEGAVVPTMTPGGIGGMSMPEKIKGDDYVIKASTNHSEFIAFVKLSLALVIVEWVRTVVRAVKGAGTFIEALAILPDNFIIITCCYGACLAIAMLNFTIKHPTNPGRNTDFFEDHSRLRNVMIWMHFLDGFWGLTIGYSIYQENTPAIIFFTMCICKFYMLSLLHRMITVEKATSYREEVLVTSKAFLHHLGSFLFLNKSRHQNTVILTTIWRFVSMSGHAAIILKGRVSEKNVERFMYAVAHVRDTIIVIIFCICVNDRDVREGFGESAVGHCAYIIVRFGPVFRMGSVYIPKSERLAWKKKSDYQRVKMMVAGHYPWLSVELGLLLMIMSMMLGTNLYLSLFPPMMI